MRKLSDCGRIVDISLTLLMKLKMNRNGSEGSFYLIEYDGKHSLPSIYSSYIK